MADEREVRYAPRAQRIRAQLEAIDVLYREVTRQVQELNAERHRDGLPAFAFEQPAAMGMLNRLRRVG